MFGARGWFAVCIGVVLELYPMNSLGNNTEPWIPEATHYVASAKARDCLSFRSLVGQTQRQIQEFERLVQAQIIILKQRRQDLEACALGKGFRPTNEEDETLIAEICPVAYEAWLSPSYRLRMYREDITSANETLSEARSHLRNYCGRAPASMVQAYVQ